MAVAVDRARSPSRDPINEILNPSEFSPSYTFAFSDFLKKEYRFGLDPSRPYCKAFREGHCPLGNACPDKHQVTHSFNNLVCKHWLRGLCKKGDQCEFLHEYNLRRMPECNHYTRSLYCPNGDECLYLHIDPLSKIPSCPHYEKGFCPLGPHCSKKHVRKTICRFYLAGFCPYGRQCKEGAHPRWPQHLPKPTVKVVRSAEEVEREHARIIEEGEREQIERERKWEERGGRGARKFGRWQRRQGGHDR